MTKDEWLSCTDAMAMLQFLRDQPVCRPSSRQLRLLACACCRHGWDLLTDQRSRNAVEIGERYADGRASDRKRRSAYRAASDAARAMLGDIERAEQATGTYDTDELDAAGAALTTVLTNHQLRLFGRLANWDKVVYLARYRVGRKLWEDLPSAEDVAPRLVRDILGGPFGPVAGSPV
ncbi:hypothetical protein GobsT_22540 [Gemmata obscuriglobus]|uniref:Uncharacterized protein n=2 Tax=Gemmata obscuriglobus TaxID=114 RepID=A0A2Z3H517_9BACT|nr:hypothetical protein C1280_22150 [Gemmata obscuriglobus]QEG27498.1 hypothetical protein GobsT_22540 [Gemmata obscuriglobus]VTS04515.1 Uncharacterized protein OS=Singulisphaera acidiphila (strain ATCC BAA-1392 / DSM 18658 / VKM B-2454 / MOB10) GN=Sinac_4631 PE=4 SV=1 [Gemmata obscuriglobus UQM 2246]